MLIDHTFDQEKHLYLVPKQFVMSTSAVIALNGLSDYGPVPKVVLGEASERGTEFHALIHALEMHEPREVSDDMKPFLEGYLNFKAAFGFKRFGSMERSCVYQHPGTEILIGGTPDMTGFIDKQLYVIDLKTNYPAYGCAKQQKRLAWRLQTQSYAEILEADDVPNVKRAVVHCHPECGKVRERSPLDSSFIRLGKTTSSSGTQR